MPRAEGKMTLFGPACPTGEEDFPVSEKVEVATLSGFEAVVDREELLGFGMRSDCSDAQLCDNTTTQLCCSSVEI